MKNSCSHMIWSCSQPASVLLPFSFSYHSWHWMQCFTRWICTFFPQLSSCWKHNPYVKMLGFLSHSAWCTCLCYFNIHGARAHNWADFRLHLCQLHHHFHSWLNVTVAIGANFQLSRPLLSWYPSSRLCNWDAGASSIIRTLCRDDISLIWLVTLALNRINLMVKVTVVTTTLGTCSYMDHSPISSWWRFELLSLMPPTCRGGTCRQDWFTPIYVPLFCASNGGSMLLRFWRHNWRCNSPKFKYA